MKTLVTAFLAGALFAVGLLLSGMTQPGKVIGFLDVTGDWDPSLALVMAGAIGVHALAYRLVPRLRGPLLGGPWALPTRRDLDARLLGGAALFGAGWGLAGICPGPGLVAAPAGTSYVLTFVAAMVVGMFGHDLFERWRARVAVAAPRAAAPPAR